MPCRSSTVTRYIVLLLTSFLLPAGGARAGGQGADLPPYPLPVRETELRIAAQSRMVCVANPGIVCNAPYLDATSDSTNTDGGTFRSASCPGAPHGTCRPDYIAGAEITGELVVDWPIVRSAIGGPFPPPDPDPGLNCNATDEYKICHVDGLIELNVTAPGVVVSNPIAVLDSTLLPNDECRCIEQGFQLEAEFEGEEIEQYWFTRNVGATCDIALEYASFLPHDQIRSIAQQAFPIELCQPDGMGGCQFNPDPVFVEPDGSLTKGCGSAPSNTFTIRFAHPNEPLVFEKKMLPVSGPRALADVNGDNALDVMDQSILTVHLNDGTNAFNPHATGLPLVGSTLGLADWNDDGDVDLLASSGSGPRLYPGDGTGTFDDPSSFLIATGPAGPGPIVDLNGDTLPDANVGSRIIWNQTGGPISPATDSIPSIEGGMADLDSDSDLDILSGTNFPERVEWAENSGPGSFPVQTAVSFPPGDDLVPMIGQDLVDLLQCENPYPSDCCEDHAGTGCDDMTCQMAVCAEDANCCSFPWDESCVDLARNLCSVCVDPALPNCCSALHGTPGCEAMGCEDIVCHPEREPSCCSGTWNSLCAELADVWCLECFEYAVSCAMPNVEDVSAGDVEGDGDADLVVSVELRQDLEHPNSSPNIEPIYFLWLPNLQVDDPQASGGKPLFDPATAGWQLIGPGQREIEMVDLDGDGDPDALGEGYWYRNDGGTFSGPYGLRGPISDSQFVDILFPADTDNDGDMDVVTVDFLYKRVPEPSVGLMLAAGLAALLGLDRRRIGRNR